ncbi:MAG: flagellar biosynthesis protein FlhB [Spirochaetaceae bacterium]|nr:flagellar biosynthesis protein FlhB [Spirochaetaceae bacterium]
MIVEETKLVLVSQRIDLQWFAAEDEGRTEQPTEHKLKKAREEGRVPKSQEITGALVLLFPVLVLFMLGSWIFKNCIELVRFYFSHSTEMGLLDGALYRGILEYFTKMMLPIALTAMVAGIIGNIVQTRGIVFSLKPIAPNFSKIVPHFGQYFKKTLFSFEGLFNIVKSLLKVIVLFVIAYILIKNDLPKLLSLLNVNLWQGVVYIAFMTIKLLIIAAVVFLIVAIPDYLVQRHQFMESMKMTKQEVKQEYKDLEGDPLVKSRIRQRMNEILQESMMKNVAEADVIITNPTHFAVAIKYDNETMQGPQVTAKGVDDVAMRIKEVAKNNNVPIVENRPLARGLYAKVEIGDIIPEMYYNALSIILAKVYKMKNKM